MKKLGAREYFAVINKALNDTYGDSLIDTGTDLVMTKAVMKKLRPYLNLNSKDMSDKEWQKWLETRTSDIKEIVESEKNQVDDNGNLLKGEVSKETKNEFLLNFKFQ